MITYKQSGVDIEAGYEAVERIKKLAKNIGFFGGFFALDKKNYLVAGADGVGTKVKIAKEMNRWDTIGIDLVAMNTDDVVCSGAKPLFFLDYIACHKINPKTIEHIVKGIVAGCKLAGCSLIGGETADMGDLYQPGDHDLAGFAVGVIEKNKIIDGKRIKNGDQIIALASSGLHSNGYSLARKVMLEVAGFKYSDKPELLKCSVGEELLKPTKIYTKSILELIKKVKVKGIAHITGGGLPENVARLLSKGVQAIIHQEEVKPQAIFRLIQRLGKIEQKEMFNTFNMGIGMVVVVDSASVQNALKILKKQKEEAWVVGEIIKGKGEVIII